MLTHAALVRFQDIRIASIFRRRPLSALNLCMVFYWLRQAHLNLNPDALIPALLYIFFVTGFPEIRQTK
jgi:hypothetical protein